MSLFSQSAGRAETRDGGWKLDTAGDFEGRTMEQGRVSVILFKKFYTVYLFL
jgi:hypothetical protein